VPLVPGPDFGCKDLDLLAAPVSLDDAPEGHFRVAVGEDHITVTDMAGAEPGYPLNRLL
jgi:hypothetical protein